MLLRGGRSGLKEPLPRRPGWLCGARGRWTRCGITSAPPRRGRGVHRQTRPRPATAPHPAPHCNNMQHLCRTSLRVGLARSNPLRLTAIRTFGADAVRAACPPAIPLDPLPRCRHQLAGGGSACGLVPGTFARSWVVSSKTSHVWLATKPAGSRGMSTWDAVGFALPIAV